MEDRYAGFCAALAAAGVLPDPELMHRGNLDVPSGRAAANALLDAADPPTAIFAFNDNMAVGAIQAAAQRGLARAARPVRRRLRRARASRIVTPNLTTVRQPLEEMGRLAVQLLARRHRGPRSEAMRVELATALVPGASTAPPA